MEKLNPAVKEKVFALLHDLTAINVFFDEKAEEFLKSERRGEEGDILISAQSLKELDEEVRYRVLSNLLQRIEPPFLPHREHIRLIEKVLAGTRPNLSAMLPNGIKVKKTYDQIIFTKKATVQPVEGSFKVRIGNNVVEPLGLTLDVTELDGQSKDIPIASNIAYFDLEKLSDLSMRTFIPGDRFVPLGMTQATKLKDFFIGRKIPREERRQLPLLLSGRDIIWIVGHRIDERYKITKETTRVLKVTAYRP
jgi:tRNA(Ile)-lysidine synthase